MTSGSAGDRAGFPHERRKDRCETTLGALSRLLEAARRRAETEALLVCDSAGLLVAGSGPAQLCDELAAHAPLVQALPANDTVANSLTALERRLRVQRLCIDGLEVIVCGTAADREVLSAVAAGCERILGRRRPRA